MLPVFGVVIAAGAVVVIVVHTIRRGRFNAGDALSWQFDSSDSWWDSSSNSSSGSGSSSGSSSDGSSSGGGSW